MMQPTPVVLDVDGSVGPLAREKRLPLADWQELVRFGCGLRSFRRFSQAMKEQLPAQHGTVLMGSGDFHHLSWPLIERCIADKGFSAKHPLRVVVLDNHPASIMVGSQVPVQTATTNFTSGSTGNTNSYEWKDTGVNLSVVPSVNSGNLVSLQIDQTYSEVGSKDEITGQSKFYQRQLSSKVAIPFR